MELKNILLSISEPTDSEVYHVKDVPNFQSYKIGRDNNGNIVFLIIPNSFLSKKSPLNYSLKNLTIEYGLEGTLLINEKEKQEKFICIKLKDNDENKNLKEIFFNICSMLLEELGDEPNFELVIKYLEGLKNLFSKLVKKSSKSEIGLWGELFIIFNSITPTELIKSWHINSKETFDFTFSNFKIEVKTTQKNERIHDFSNNQLNKLIEYNGFIASIMTFISENGVTIFDLIELINERIEVNARKSLIEKVIDVAGDKYDSFTTKYDLTYAKESLKLFEAKRLPSLKEFTIPSEISGIKFLLNFENQSEIKYNENVVIDEMINTLGQSSY